MSSAVIIGSGLGGLEIALMLAKRGYQVTVLEKQKQLGGCMQSYRRGSINLDTGLHYVGGLDEHGSLYSRFKELGLMTLPWRRMDLDAFEEIYTHNGKYIWPQGIDRFIHAMQQYFPDQKEGLEKYGKLLRCTDEEWMQKTNAWDYINSIITDPELVEVLSAPAMCKMELRRQSLPLFTFVHGTAAFIGSSWRLAGEGNMLVECLVNQIKKHGGQLYANKEVCKLTESDGRIISAICRDDSVYEADIFISDAHPATTLHLLEESQVVKKIFRRRMLSQENTVGMFTLQLQIKPGAVKYFNRNILVAGQHSVWDNAVEEDHVVKGVMISCPLADVIDGYATCIDILTPMSWDAVKTWEDSRVFHRPDEYYKMKDYVARQCISMAATAIPELEKSIECMYSSTPLTYRDYNASPQGSAFGYRKDYQNPLMTIVSARTPVHNLLLTGQSLMLHGLHGVTMTAEYTLRSMGEN